MRYNMILLTITLFFALATSSYCMDFSKHPSFNSMWAKVYFSNTSKETIIKDFCSFPEIVDATHKQNILHLAAVAIEMPDLIDELIIARPQLVYYLDSPNNDGVTPRTLMQQLQSQKVTSISVVPRPSTSSPVAVIKIPKQTIQESVAELDKIIAAKIALSNQNRPHAPFSVIEKTRILHIITQMDHPEGGTPLHLAAGIRGYPELITALLAFKPELRNQLNNTDNKGFTALDIATLKENSAAVDAFRAAGAKENL